MTAGQCAVTDVCSVIVLKAESDLPEECNDGRVTFSDKRGLGRTFTFSLCFGLKSAFAEDFRVMLVYKNVGQSLQYANGTYKCVFFLLLQYRHR